MKNVKKGWGKKTEKRGDKKKRERERERGEGGEEECVTGVGRKTALEGQILRLGGIQDGVSEEISEGFKAKFTQNIEAI